MAPGSPRIITWRSASGPTPAPCASSGATRRRAVRSSPAPQTAAHRERTDTVPRFAGQGMSAPLAVYQGAGRTRASEVPKLLVNPRATVSYGADTLRFYLEAYGERPGTRLVARALDQGGHEVWHDTL